MRRLAIVAAMVASVVALAGCSGSDPEPSDTGSSQVQPSVTGSSQIQPSVSPEPSQSPLYPDHLLGEIQKPYVEADFGDEYFVTYGHYTGPDSSRYGSGCTPPSDGELPDGIWFGYLGGWGLDEVGFDIACIDHDGVANGSQRVRMLPVSERAQYLLEGLSVKVAFSWDRVVAAHSDYPPPQIDDAVWLYVNGGEVTQIEAAIDSLDFDAIQGSPYNPLDRYSEPYIDPDDAFAPIVSSPSVLREGELYIQGPDERGGPPGPTNGAYGSGCSPGEGDALPDGAWFGLIRDVSNGQLVIDLACYWAEDSPQAQAVYYACEATRSEYGECNPYGVITNDYFSTRTNPLAEDGQVLTSSGAYPFANLIELDDEDIWPIVIDPGRYGSLVWIYINDGEVTAIVGS